MIVKVSFPALEGRCPMITPRWTTLVATLRCVGPSRGAECSGRYPRHSCPPRPRNTPVEVGPRQPEHPCSLTIPAPSTHAMVDIMDMVLNRYIRVRCSLFLEKPHCDTVGILNCDLFQLPSFSTSILSNFTC